MTAAQEQSLAKTEPTQLVVVESWQSTEALKARINQIQRLMNEVLQKDVDYGIIPGLPKGSKPSLLKAGSEQILAMFRIAVEPIVEDLSTEDCFRYRVTCRLTDTRTEAFLGAGVGECSTNETKYKWKRTYSQKEYEATPPDQRRSKWVSYRDDHNQPQEVEYLMIRQEPADLANTVLKMAKKRAQIDGTLTVTGASSMFSQDLEEDELAGESHTETTTTRRGKKGQAQKQEDVKCADCGAINGHLPSCKYHPNAKKEAKETKPAPVETKPAKPETVQGEVVVDKIVVQIKTATPKKTQAGASYVVYDVVDNENKERLIYCFHKTVNEELARAAVNKVSMLRYSIQKRGEQIYMVIDEILEIAGVQYKDGKPVGAQAKEEEPW
jgi:hypothetical protein